jgi:hypothetical protein
MEDDVTGPNHRDPVLYASARRGGSPRRIRAPSRVSLLVVDHRRHMYIMIAYSIQMLRRHTGERHLSQAA